MKIKCGREGVGWDCGFILGPLLCPTLILLSTSAGGGCSKSPKEHMSGLAPWIWEHRAL